MLELGSVVEIAGNSLPFMIIGYYPYNEEENRVYDYICIPHFLGDLGQNEFLLVEKEGISRTLHHGYRNEIADDFLRRLQALSETQNIKSVILNGM